MYQNIFTTAVYCSYMYYSGIIMGFIYMYIGFIDIDAKGNATTIWCLIDLIAYITHFVV